MVALIIHLNRCCHSSGRITCADEKTVSHPRQLRSHLLFAQSNSAHLHTQTNCHLLSVQRLIFLTHFGRNQVKIRKNLMETLIESSIIQRIYKFNFFTRLFLFRFFAVQTVFVRCWIATHHVRIRHCFCHRI